MASELIFEEIIPEHFKTVTPNQIAIEAKLQPLTDVKIAKILTISADAEILACEALAGEARYNGRANFKVLFLDTDGATNSMDYNADFSDKVSDECIMPSSELMLQAKVLDTETVSVTQTELKVSAAIEICCKVLVKEQINLLKEGSEEIYTQTEEFEYDVVSSKCSETFYINEEFEPKDNIVNILLCEANHITKEVSAGLDCIVLSGTIDLNVIYASDNGLIKNENFAAEYTHEINAMGARIDDKVIYAVKINGFTVTLADDLATNTKSIKCDFKMQADCRAVRKAKAVAVVDAFSVSKEIRIIGESFEIKQFEGVKTIDQTIDGSAEMGDDLPGVDKVICLTSSKAQVANIYNDGDKLIIEGVLHTGIIYWNNEFETRNSVSVELPYSITAKCDLPKGNLEFDGEACVKKITAHPKKKGDIELRADIRFCINVYRKKIGYYIKEIQIGEIKLTKDCAIAVYITREGEKLWDVAKALHTTPEIILKNNPNLKEPLGAGERILIYRQITADI
jgi:hypothetical protein